MSRAILLCPVILALLVAPSLAVTCDSYKTEEKCTGMVDGTNKCAWEGGACVTTSETLGEGMVGITSVPVDMGMPDVAVPPLLPLALHAWPTWKCSLTTRPRMPVKWLYMEDVVPLKTSSVHSKNVKLQLQLSVE